MQLIATILMLIIFYRGFPATSRGAVKPHKNKVGYSASAMFRLGINEEMATTLAALTLPQMVKLAETNQLVCHFRFDSHQTITQLTQDSRVDDLQQIHTGIMLSTRLLNDVNQPEEALRKKRA